MKFHLDISAHIHYNIITARETKLIQTKGGWCSINNDRAEAHEVNLMGMTNEQLTKYDILVRIDQTDRLMEMSEDPDFRSKCEEIKKALRQELEATPKNLP